MCQLASQSRLLFLDRYGDAFIRILERPLQKSLFSASVSKSFSAAVLRCGGAAVMLVLVKRYSCSCLVKRVRDPCSCSLLVISYQLLVICHLPFEVFHFDLTFGLFHLSFGISPSASNL